MPLPKLKSDFLQHVDNSDDVVGILVPGTRKVKCSFANMILPLGNYMKLLPTKKPVVS